MMSFYDWLISMEPFYRFGCFFFLENMDLFNYHFKSPEPTLSVSRRRAEVSLKNLWKTQSFFLLNIFTGHCLRQDKTKEVLSVLIIYVKSFFSDPNSECVNIFMELSLCSNCIWICCALRLENVLIRSCHAGF